MRQLALTLLLLSLSSSAPAQNAPGSSIKVAEVDGSLSGYAINPEIRKDATLTSIGSDSMDPLMQLWLDDFVGVYPGLHYTLVAEGSPTCLAAMMAGQSILGPMSRELTKSELAEFQARFGYLPIRLVVAMDALAIYVNANNPIAKLSLEQVDAAFSREQRAGYASKVETWGDLGLGQEWAARPIQPYGREASSGTSSFFREHVLLQGQYKPSVKEVSDQFGLIEAAAVDPAGIAYGPVENAMRMVKAVPVIALRGRTPIAPTVSNILSGKYPLARFLYIYLNARPGQPIDPLAKDFLRFVLSRQGQTDVATYGAIPLQADLAAINLGKVR